MDNEKSDVKKNRRDILKMTAAAGTVGTLGGISLSGGASADDRIPSDVITEDGQIVGFEDEDVTVEDTTLVKEGQARREAQGAMSREEVREVRDWFQDKGLRPNVSESFAQEITYDDEELNESDPVVVTIPYVPTGQDEGKGGLLNLFMVDDESQRVAAGVFGLHMEAVGDETHVTVVGKDEGKAAIIYEGSKTNEISASQSLQCATCEIVFDGICTGTYGAVGVKGCAFTCTASGPAWAVCTVVCSALVIAISKYGCYYSSGFFCENMVDFC